MQTSTANSRPPVHLESNLNQNLLNYAAAAGAASVSLLALAHPAEAKVIYTAANIRVPGNVGVVQFDINNDGIPDFGISNPYGTCEAPGRLRPGGHRQEGCSFGDIYLIPALASNEVGVVDNCAAELPEKIRVGPGKNLQPGAQLMFWAFGDATSAHKGCPWQGNKGGYLGLKFVANGETHYGWARVSLVGGITITGYAYETVPNQSIRTGATSGLYEEATVANSPVIPSSDHPSGSVASASQASASLGFLAGGATTLSAWRRPEEMN